MSVTLMPYSINPLTSNVNVQLFPIRYNESNQNKGKRQSNTLTAFSSLTPTLSQNNIHNIPHEKGIRHHVKQIQTEPLRTQYNLQRSEISDLRCRSGQHKRNCTSDTYAFPEPLLQQRDRSVHTKRRCNTKYTGNDNSQDSNPVFSEQSYRMMDPVFQKNRHCRTDQHPQNPVPEYLMKLQIKIIPEIDEFPSYDFRHLITPVLSLVDGNQVIRPASKPDIFCMLQRMKPIS